MNYLFIIFPSTSEFNFRISVLEDSEQVVQNKLVWHKKNTFECKTSEFLKSHICLKAASPWRIQLPYILLGSNSWEKRSAPHPNRHYRKAIICPIYSLKGPFIFAKIHLFFCTCPFSHFLRSHLFSQKCP